MGSVCHAAGRIERQSSRRNIIRRKNMVKKSNAVQIPAPKTETIEIKIKGTTPLLMEKMDTKVAEVYDKKKAKQLYKEDTRSEYEKVEDKIHYTEDGNVGFPSAGFLNGMLDVAPRINGKQKFPAKIDIKQGIRFTEEIVPIDFEEKKVHKAVGRTSGRGKGSPRLIVRPQFNGWSARLRLTYNKEIFSLEQVINLINWAGINCGIGGWRPSCSGTFGTYTVSGGK